MRSKEGVPRLGTENYDLDVRVSAELSFRLKAGCQCLGWRTEVAVPDDLACTAVVDYEVVLHARSLPLIGRVSHLLQHISQVSFKLFEPPSPRPDPPGPQFVYESSHLYK